MSGTDAPEATAADVDRALAICHRHLGTREHSVAELRHRLERAGLAEPAIDAAIDIVRGQGYLDDERYARMLAEDRRALDGWGVQRIRARLESAGIERDLIDATLAGYDAASELDAACALLERRCRQALDSDRERQRAFAILVRAGYDAEIAYDAIRAAGRGAA
jgi:regulatory protein